MIGTSPSMGERILSRPTISVASPRANLNPLSSMAALIWAKRLDFAAESEARNSPVSMLVRTEST